MTAVFTIGHGTRPAEELIACLIAELLVAQGHSVMHLIRPGRSEPHRLYDESEVRDRRLHLCGNLVA